MCFVVAASVVTIRSYWWVLEQTLSRVTKRVVRLYGPRFLECRDRLNGVVEKIAEGGGGGEGQAGEVEGFVGMGVGEFALGDVLIAESLLDEAAALHLAGVGAQLFEDEKALTAEWAADVGREPGVGSGELHECGLLSILNSGHVCSWSVCAEIDYGFRG